MKNRNFYFMKIIYLLYFNKLRLRASTKAANVFFKVNYPEVNPMSIYIINSYQMYFFRN